MDNSNYRVDRPIYSYEDLTSVFSEEKSQSNPLKTLKSKVKCPRPSLKSVGKKIIPFPFILATFYTWKLLISDLIAGFTMLIFHIPQGMAYALLAGLQPIHGLYASFIPPLIYALFGTSRHLAMGTFSIISILAATPAIREATLMITSSNETSSNGQTQLSFESAKFHVSMATCLLAGLFQLLMGFFKFGTLMNYVSDSMIGGFTTATAFHVLVSQLGEMLGYSVPRFSGVGELPYKIFLFVSHAGRLHWLTLGISTGCILILFLFSELINPPFQKKFKIPIPIQFILVVVATIISYYCQLSAKFSVKTVGPLPSGLPSVIVPHVKIFPRIILDSFLLALVGFIMNSALVKIYALQFKYEADFNQELVAYGLTNIIGSFFQCMMSAGSLARSAVVVQVGMQSQVASLISCLFMLFVLLFISPLFQFVPDCVLAAIIVVSLKGMIMQFKQLPSLYRMSKFDFNIWMVTFVATIVLDVPVGLVCGVVFSLLTIVIRLQNPKSHLLGQLPNTNIYKDIKVFKCAKEIAGVKIFRFEAPLYFANAERFKMKLYRKANIAVVQKSIETKSIKGSEVPASDITNSVMNSTVDINIPNSIISISKGMAPEKIHVEAPLSTCSEVTVIKLVDPQIQIKFVILDFSAINYIDNVAVRVLENIYCRLKTLDISMFIASPNNDTRQMLEKSKFAKEHLNRIMFVTVHDAVLKCRAQEENESYKIIADM